MTEEEILSRKPYTDAPPEPTLEDRASDLVNALMHQLRTDGNIRYVIDDLPMERKQMLHARLCMIATIALRGEPLVEVAVESVASSSPVPQAPKAPDTVPGVPPLPAGGVVSVGISESDGFVVQPGGLLLSQQVKP